VAYPDRPLTVPQIEKALYTTLQDDLPIALRECSEYAANDGYYTPNREFRKEITYQLLREQDIPHDSGRVCLVRVDSITSGRRQSRWTVRVSDDPAPMM
jgi:hypothetical protein